MVFLCFSRVKILHTAPLRPYKVLNTLNGIRNVIIFSRVLQLGTKRQESRYWIQLQKAMMSLNKYELHFCADVFEGNRLSSETCRWQFHFILAIIPD